MVVYRGNSGGRQSGVKAGKTGVVGLILVSDRILTILIIPQTVITARDDKIA